MRRRLLEAGTALLAGALFIHATPPSMLLSQAYLRLIPGGVPAAGYFNMTNYGHAALVLTGAQSQDCSSVMMHRSSTGGGMARMEDVSSVTVARGQRFAFAPGGFHLMCMNPGARLHVGGTTRITLRFQGGATLPVAFHVVNARGGSHEN
jgi:copper(I)-binding protein